MTGRRKHRHYLKGSLFCGYCGYRFVFSRNKGRGGTYDYFVCLGRQKHTGCEQPHVTVDTVEAKVEEYWRKVQLDPERKTTIEAAFRQHLATAKELVGRERDTQQRRQAKLEAQRRKLMQAHNDDAIAPDLFKSEQQRITAELDSARRILEACDLQFATIEANYDDVLALASDAQALYRLAGNNERRKLNQAVFEKLWVSSSVPT